MVDNSPQNGNSFNAENQENNNENKKFGVKPNLRLLTTCVLILILFFLFNFNKIIFYFFKSVDLPPKFVVTQIIKLVNDAFLLIGYDSFRIEYKGYSGLGYKGIDRDLERFCDSYIYHPNFKKLDMTDTLSGSKFNVKFEPIYTDSGNIILFGGWSDCSPVKISRHSLDLKTSFEKYLPEDIYIYKVDLNNLDSMYNFLSSSRFLDTNVAIEKYDKNKVFIISRSYTYIYDIDKKEVTLKKKHEGVRVAKALKPVKISQNEYLIFGDFYSETDDYYFGIIFNTDNYSIRLLQEKSDLINKTEQDISSIIKIKDNIYCFPFLNQQHYTPNWLKKYNIKTNTFKDIYKMRMPSMKKQRIVPVLLKNGKILIFYKQTSCMIFPPFITSSRKIHSYCEIFDPTTEKVKKSLICPEDIVVPPLVLNNGDILFVQKNKIKIAPEKFFR